MNMKKYYGQLVGAKILGFHFEEDEFGGGDFPVYTLEKEGTLVQMTLSMDQEGNAGGFAFLEEAK